MMRLSDMRISVRCITEQSSVCTFKVLSASVQKNKDGNITGCTLTCRVIDGIRQNFRLSASAAHAVEELQTKLNRGAVVRVKFEQLVIRPFAFLNDSGQLLSGVSTKAESFIIASEEEAETDDVDLSDIDI